MKKLDKLFKEFPDLKIIENWIRKQVEARGRNVIKNLFRNYRVRKPKRFNEKMEIIKNSSDDLRKLSALWYLDIVYSGNSYFEYLNKCFSKLKNLNGFGSLLKRIRKNPEQFDDVLSEIEFNAYFSGRYTIEIEPEIGNKKLDSRVLLDKRGILFEIFTPRPYKPLQETQKTKKAILIPNISKSKILDKLRDQIIPIKSLIKEPVIIVIHTKYSVIDEYDILDSLFGQLRLNTIIEKQTGKMIYDYWDRDKNSIADKEPLAELISGVLIYTRNLNKDGVEFKKELILNKNLKYPLTLREYKKLNRFDLNKII